ncbi:MAG: hypothetical protein KJ769_00905 [Candidatus Margulisbacteria bacterium]|nr:hypothetical protein [Candidatus Margulisiibacteriota bacterium]
MANLCIFEDSGYQKLFPLCLMRPVFEIKCGISTLLQKILHSYLSVEKDIAVSLECREYLQEVVKNNHHEKPVNALPYANDCLFINGRVLADINLSRQIPFSGNDEIFVAGSTVVAARLSKDNLNKLRDHLGKETFEEILLSLKKYAKTTSIDIKTIDYPWQLIKENPSEIENDYQKLWGKGKIKGKLNKEVVIYDKKNVVIEDGAKIESFVVIDSSNGPVIINEGAHILPHTTIQGPAYIGKNTKILGGSIRGGTTIGPNCKIHGEVNSSIIHGYSNKAHYGFLGHSYLCEWVNLGAGTTNSNLKNNYGNVKIWNKGNLIDSGEQVIGCFIGDHSKTAIGTLLNTGTVISIFCNIFEGMPPKYVGLFAFGLKKKFNLDKAIEIAKVVMKRRGIEITAEDTNLIKLLYSFKT